MADILHCAKAPACLHTEYASDEDPDAGLSEMYNHIFWNHAKRDRELTHTLLAKVKAEPTDGDD